MKLKRGRLIGQHINLNGNKSRFVTFYGIGDIRLIYIHIDIIKNNIKTIWQILARLGKYQIQGGLKSPWWFGYK